MILFNLYFQGYQGQNGLFFFSPVYNCRSAYVNEAKKVIDEVNKEIDLVFEIKNEEMQSLHDIAEMKVAIWHWDSEPKPWTLAKEKMGDPERLWMQEFYSLLKKLATIEGGTLIKRLYDSSLKILPVFSDPGVDTDLSVSLANLTEGLNSLPDTTVNASTIALCRTESELESVRIYRAPQEEEGDGAPPRWLVRVPVGGERNWCALYALGLSENQEAENVIEGHNEQWIDADDRAFWERMSQISGSAIEIYTALDYGPRDPRNGTLRLVARYGNGGSVKRVYARNGHYNALLLPDEVGDFIASRDPEKQGPPSF